MYLCALLWRRTRAKTEKEIVVHFLLYSKTLRPKAAALLVGFDWKIVLTEIFEAYWKICIKDKTWHLELNDATLAVTRLESHTAYWLKEIKKSWFVVIKLVFCTPTKLQNILIFLLPQDLVCLRDFFRRNTVLICTYARIKVWKTTFLSLRCNSIAWL